ncbi:hypothetical protein BJX96DRAFT_154596 [Aspergillus floccosus]
MCRPPPVHHDHHHIIEKEGGEIDRRVRRGWYTANKHWDRKIWGSALSSPHGRLQLLCPTSGATICLDLPGNGCRPDQSAARVCFLPGLTRDFGEQAAASPSPSDRYATPKPYQSYNTGICFFTLFFHSFTRRRNS